MVDLAERGVHFVEFIDPNFLGDRTGISRAIEVGSLLRQAALDVRFAFAARVDTLLAYREILPQLKQAGLIRIETGIEGADDESLRYFNKQTTRDMNRRCLQLLNELGIDAQIEFIMFRPETTSKHIEANLDLLREARALGFSIRKALYNILRLENGSRLTTKFLAEGKARKGAFFTYEYEFEDTITRDFYSALSEYYPKSGLAEYHAIARLRALIDGVSGPGAGDLRVHYSDCLHKSEELALSYFTAIWNSINAGNVEWRDQVKNIDESFDDSCSNVLRLTEDLQRIIEASPTGACFAD